MLALLFAPAFGQTEPRMASEILPSGPPHQVPVEAMHLFDEGEALLAQERYDEALQAFDQAIEIDPQYELAWKEKTSLLKMLGRSIEADAASARIKELNAAQTTSILDHSMASMVDESIRNASKRTQEFSVNYSKAFSWLSLKNVKAGPVSWDWYSPAGDLLHRDEAVIPDPPSGDFWSTYNVWSALDIAGHPAANLSGGWHVDVFFGGQKILTEYFWISGGQRPTEPTESAEPIGLIEPEDRYSYNFRGSFEDAYNSLHNQSKYDEAIRKGDRLKDEGRYDEALHFYNEAIDLEPSTFYDWTAYWRVWNSKGDALYKKGKYAEALQAFDKAIELIPDNSIIWVNKGNALKALGRTNESDAAYATARELGDYSAWIPETNATGINLTSLYFIGILDHCMASNVDESANDVIIRTSTFTSTDSKIYSWLNLGHVLGATVTWHWYSPDGNPYKTGQVDIDRNPNGGYWPSYYVWYGLNVADIPKEQYLSGNWHADIYINGRKRLTEQFNLSIGSGTSTINPSATSGSATAHGTFTILDHCMASEIDDATDRPVMTAKTNEIKDTLVPYSWLQLGNIGAARIEWDWKGGEYTANAENYEITHTYDIPPNPKGGYYASYNVWDFIDIPSMLQDFEYGESNEWDARRSAEEEGYSYYGTNPIPDPRGDWTVDVYVNDQWLLQEQFIVV